MDDLEYFITSMDDREDYTVASERSRQEALTQNQERLARIRERLESTPVDEMISKAHASGTGPIRWWSIFLCLVILYFTVRYFRPRGGGEEGKEREERTSSSDNHAPRIRGIIHDAPIFVDERRLEWPQFYDHWPLPNLTCPPPQDSKPDEPTLIDSLKFLLKLCIVWPLNLLVWFCVFIYTNFDYLSGGAPQRLSRLLSQIFWICIGIIAVTIRTICSVYLTIKIIAQRMFSSSRATVALRCELFVNGDFAHWVWRWYRLVVYWTIRILLGCFLVWAFCTFMYTWYTSRDSETVRFNPVISGDSTRRWWNRGKHVETIVTQHDGAIFTINPIIRTAAAAPTVTAVTAAHRPPPSAEEGEERYITSTVYFTEIETKWSVQPLVSTVRATSTTEQTVTVTSPPYNRTVTVKEHCSHHGLKPLNGTQINGETRRFMHVSIEVKYCSQCKQRHCCEFEVHGSVI